MNPDTKKLEGVPQEWIKSEKLSQYILIFYFLDGFRGDIDTTKVVITRNFPDAVNVSRIPIELIGIINFFSFSLKTYSNKDDINSIPATISKPMNVKREVHIELDENYPFGLKVFSIFINDRKIFQKTNRDCHSNGKKFS